MIQEREAGGGEGGKIPEGGGGVVFQGKEEGREVDGPGFTLPIVVGLDWALVVDDFSDGP